jgi:WD40 repeat protein/HEAT repeat protein
VPIEVVCPCGKTYPVRDEFAGMTVECPDCKTLLTIPGTPPAAKKPAVRVEVVRDDPPPVRVEVIRDEVSRDTPRPRRTEAELPPDADEDDRPRRRREEDDRPRRRRDYEDEEEDEGVHSGSGIFPWLLLGGMVMLLLSTIAIVVVIVLPSGDGDGGKTASTSTSSGGGGPGEVEEPETPEPDPQFTGQPWGGHTTAILAVAYAPDGQTVMSASGGTPTHKGKKRRAGDSTVRRWEAQTGKGLRLLNDFTDGISAAAFTPSGRRAVIGTAGKVRDGKWVPGGEVAAQVWDLEEPRLVHTLGGHTDEITSVAVSRDGARALTGSADGTARWWDLAAGQELKCLRGHGQTVNCVAISPNGKLGLTGGADRTVRVWDLDQGTQVQQLGVHNDPVWAVAFSPDGRHAASAGGRREKDAAGAGDFEVRMWDVVSGREVRRFKGHTDWVGSLLFSRDGQRLLSGGADAVRVWLVGAGQEGAHYTGYLGGIRCLTFTPDGRRALSCGEDGALRQWKMPLSVPELVRDVREGNETLRAEALRALDKLGPEAVPAVPGLLEALSGADPVLRRQLLHTLKSIEKANATDVPQLARLLRQDKDGEVRQYALQALEKLGPQAEPAAEAVAEALKDSDPDVRRQAVKVLTEMGPAAAPVSRRPLVAALQDADTDISQAAEAALAKLGPPPASEVGTLRKLLQGHSVPLRRYAVRALTALAKEAAPAVPDLVALAGSDGPVELRRESLQALRQVDAGNKEVVELCTRLVKDGNESVCEEAVLVLAAAGPKAGALPGLLRALDLSTKGAALTAETALRKAELDKSHLPLLEPLLASKKSQTRKLGVEVLGRLGADAAPAVPALGQMLKEARGEERRQIVRTLARMGKAAQPAGPALAECLRDTEGDVAFEAALALVQTESQQVDAAVTVLIKSLKTAGDGRDRAHKALVQVGKPAVSGLAQSLHGMFALGKPTTPEGVANGEARLVVIQILAELGPKARTSEVQRVLASLERRDPFNLVRVTARQARLKIQSDSE